MIIRTFLERYDFSGKTIVPFCTSGSSGVGSSATNLHSLVSDTVTWLDGTRFGGSAAQADVEAWANGLGLDLKAIEKDRFGLSSYNTKEVVEELMYIENTVCRPRHIMAGI